MSPCSDGMEEIVQALLAAGEDPNRPGREGLTPLWCAWDNGHDNVAALLEKYGADANIAQLREEEGKKSQISWRKAIS